MEPLFTFMNLIALDLLLSPALNKRYQFQNSALFALIT